MSKQDVYENCQDGTRFLVRIAIYFNQLVLLNQFSSNYILYHKFNYEL